MFADLFGSSNKDPLAEFVAEQVKYVAHAHFVAKAMSKDYTISFADLPEASKLFFLNVANNANNARGYLNDFGYSNVGVSLDQLVDVKAMMFQRDAVNWYNSTIDTAELSEIVQELNATSSLKRKAIKEIDIDTTLEENLEKSLGDVASRRFA